MEKKVLLECIQKNKMKKYITFEKVYEIFIYIMVIEIFLGGSGKLYNVPWRILLMVFMFLLASIKVLGGSKLPKSLIYGLLIIWTYCILWVGIGVIKGNGLKAGIADITNFIALIYIPIILLVKRKKCVFKNIIKILKISMLILSIITITLFLGSYFLKNFNINVGLILERFNEKTNYGVITGALYNFKFARVYFMNGLFMQFSLVFFIYDILNLRRVRDYINTIVVLLGIFSSSTRGYWIGAVIVILIMFILINKMQRKKMLKILIICMLICSPIVFTNAFKTEVINRITSITDFSKDDSNKVRNIQIDSMMIKINKNPFIGSGFGANLKEYQEKTGLSGRNFEVYYLELIYKTGLIGVLILGGILFKLFYCVFKNIIFQKNIFEREEYEYVVGVTIGAISCLITGITNPYMQGTIGIFTITCFSLGYFIFNENINYVDFKEIFKLLGDKVGKS